jgi:hypothetical protein
MLHHDVVHFETQKTLLDNHKHPALYDLSNMRWSQRVHCQGVMRIAHTDERGRQNLEPALPLLSQLMRRKAHANLPSTSESAYPRTLGHPTPSPRVLRMIKVQV